MKTKKEKVFEQILFQEEIQKSGFNIVTCGDCGNVIIHRTIPMDDYETDIECPYCDFKSEPCDFPDFLYRGLEDNFKD